VPAASRARLAVHRTIDVFSTCTQRLDLWKAIHQVFEGSITPSTPWLRYAAYIPGAVIPGYIIIKPDFPECIDDFGFLWFEDEAVVAGSASWVVAGNAAVAITQEAK